MPLPLCSAEQPHRARGSHAYPGLLDVDYTVGGKQSLDWRLFTCALVWLTDGRWNRGALEL